MSEPTIALSVTLADGSTSTFYVSRMPRHWKSWVMQHMPYGTDYYGCTFSRVVLAEDRPAFLSISETDLRADR